MVLAAVAASPNAGNDDGRVYVYDVLVELIEGMGVWMTGPELRSELVRLHRVGEIVMTRCDLRAAHDAAKLTEDGTCRYMSSEWNFVCR